MMRNDLEAILDSLPAQPPRSRLDPYADLIEEMRRRNWTYRAIAEVLAEKCNLKVAPSNIHHFVRQRGLRMASKPDAARRVDGERPSALTSSGSRTGGRSGPIKQQDDEVRARIDALKRRQETGGPARKAFEFNPAEPLRLKK